MFKVLKNAVAFIALLILGLYLSVWAFSPIAANYFISQYLLEQQLELADDATIRYNPFLSTLTVDNLVVNKDDKAVFNLSSLAFEISAYQLLSNEVNVTELLIDGLYLVVNRQNDSLSVAGIHLPATNSEKNVAETTKQLNSQSPKQQAEQTAELALQLIMPNMRLTNSTIKIIDVDKTHTLQLNDVGLNVTRITPSLQNLSINILAELNESDIAVYASTEMLNEQGDIDFDIDVSEVDLYKFTHLFAPHIQVASGLVSYKGKHSLKLLKEGLRLEIADLKFRTQGVEVGKNDIHFALGEQDFSSDLMAVDLSKDTQVVVTGDGKLHWQDVTAFNKTSNQVLLAIAQLNLNDVGIYSATGSVNNTETNVESNVETNGKASSNEYRITIADISLMDSFFSNNTEDEIPALSSFSDLSIKDTALTNTALSMESIELAGLKSNVQLDKDKQVENLIISLEQLTNALAGDTSSVELEEESDSIEKTQDEEELKEAVVETHTKAPLHIQLNRFSLVDSANIQFTDRSVSPNYARYIKINELNAGPFDNQKPNQTTVVTVKGISNQYTDFDFLVNTKPFLPEPEYDLKGTLNQLDLESLTPYVKGALGYEIESGQLDLQLSTQLIGTKIQGNSHILLRGIELSSVEDYESGENSGQGYIAFNTALGMLKDSDGNVELDLPISGDTSSPSFGLSGFVTLIVKRATIAGAKEYLTMTFVPYASLVKIVLAADKHLLKVQVSDLNYQPTVVEVSESQDEFLTTFAELLKDKSDLQIKLCGVSNAQDLGKDKEAGSQLSRDEIETLIQISEQRGNNFKRYMVEEKEISSSRLLLCKPRIDNSVNSTPHIRFET